MTKEITDTLRKAKNLIENSQNWTKNTYARDKNGNPVSYRSNDAVSFCASGAIYKVCNDQYLQHVRYQNVIYYILQIIKNFEVGNWNDAASHIEVLNVFDRAIALAETTP